MKKSPSIQETMKMKTPRFRKKVAEEQEHIREEVKAYNEGRIAGLEEAIKAIFSVSASYKKEGWPDEEAGLLSQGFEDAQVLIHLALRSKLEEAKKE